MCPPWLQKAGFHLVRSTAIAATLFASISLPSLAEPLPPQSGYFTTTREDIPYGVTPRQLFMFQKPTTATPSGGGAGTKPLPGFGMIRPGSQGEGNTLNTPVQPQPIQIRVIRSNPGFLDQTDKNVINFSF